MVALSGPPAAWLRRGRQPWLCRCPLDLPVSAHRIASASILHRPVGRDQERFADGGHAGRAPRPGMVGGELHLPAQFRQLGHFRFGGFQKGGAQIAKSGA